MQSERAHHPRAAIWQSDGEWWTKGMQTVDGVPVFMCSEAGQSP